MRPDLVLRFVVGFGQKDGVWRVGLFAREEEKEGEPIAKVPLFTYPIRGELTEQRKEDISKTLTDFILVCEQPDFAVRVPIPKPEYDA
jgi:hypothetical protein